MKNICGHSNKKLYIKKFIIDWVIPLCIVYIILNFVFFNGVVVSGSMEPTLMTGSLQVGNRLAYIFGNIERGDIIYFHRDNDIVGKRVIGISGDKIEFHDGDVYINGDKIDEDYLAFDTDTNCSKTFIVPKDKVFVLGDNRENSYDSRYWEEPYINNDDIIAKYMFSSPPILKAFYKNEESFSGFLSTGASQPLNLSETGEMIIIEDYFTEKATICIDAIYGGSEAERLILTYGGNKTTSSANTDFVVVEYSTSINPTEHYIDCKLLGEDGNNLKFNGKLYSSKCYDMYSNMSYKDGVYSNIYVYYELPNTIDNYILKFGTASAEEFIDGGNITANYLIEDGEFSN